MWFAGQNDVEHCDGASLTPSLEPAGGGPCEVSGAAATDVWAACGSELYHFDGIAWSAPVALPDPATAIAAAGPSRVFVASGDHLGRVVAYDGMTLTDTLAPTIGIISLTATAADDVFLASADSILHYDGTAWTPVRQPTLPLSSYSIALVNALPGVVDIFYDNPAEPTMRQLVRTRPWNCRPHETDCSDGVDDDCDGLVDGNDPDCQP